MSDLPWVAIELTSETGRGRQGYGGVNETVLHLVRWSVRNLEGEELPFQLLYPIESRASGSTTLLSPYLWMRVSDPRTLRGITSIQGIQGIVDGADGRPLTVTHDPFIADLLARTRAISDAWSSGIACGSGVRVLLGTGRGLCGIVEQLKDDDATVRIALRSRAVRLRIPVRALQRLSSAPSDYFEKEDY